MTKKFKVSTLGVKCSRRLGCGLIGAAIIYPGGTKICSGKHVYEVIDPEQYEIYDYTFDTTRPEMFIEGEGDVPTNS